MAVAISFSLLCVGSALYLSAATLNYLNYYPALGQIGSHIRVDNVSVVQGTNQSRIDSRITIENPTDYAGLRLGEASLSMFFQVKDTNTSLFSVNTLNEIQPIGGDLGPHSTVSHNVVIQLTPEKASSFASFIGSYDGRVIAKVTLTVDIITFLDSVTGRLSYSWVGDLPLSNA